MPTISLSSLHLAVIRPYTTRSLLPYISRYSFTLHYITPNSIFTPIMAPRRASTRGGSTTRASRNRATGGIRKNTRTRRQPNRYGHSAEQASTPQRSPAASNTTSDSDTAEPSIPEYSHSPSLSTNRLQQSRSPTRQNSPAQQDEAPNSPSPPETRASSPATVEGSVNLSTMRELLRSHEQDIVDRVVLQLSTHNLPQPSHTDSNLPSSFHMHPGTQPSIQNST